jgi:uncharacterized ion transporter superfamily protein YfcC
VNDDETGEVIQNTDLGEQVNTGRSVVHRQLEEIQAEAHTGKFGGASGKLVAKLLDGSSQSTAIATLFLTLAIGGMIGIVRGIGIPPIGALIAGVCVPFAGWLLIYFTTGRSRRR